MPDSPRHSLRTPATGATHAAFRPPPCTHPLTLQHRISLAPPPGRYHLPLAELGGDFYDELKSLSSGYASFDYEEAEYRWVAGVCDAGQRAASD